MKLKYIFAVFVLAVVGFGVWYFSKPSVEPINNQENTLTPQPPGQSTGDVVEEVPNALEGELRDSSDKRRGNLMLLLKDSDRIIYLNTSRDFSQLIGKQVSVSIEGSLDDFRLLDIKELK
jgi:hypothetical protein